MTGKNPVLMTHENPTGWKLEELAAQLITEMAAETTKVEGLLLNEADPKNISALLIAKTNNLAIVRLLQVIQETQEDTMQTFARYLGPDQGPTGTPRIGALEVTTDGFGLLYQRHSNTVEWMAFLVRQAGNIYEVINGGVTVGPEARFFFWSPDRPAELQVASVPPGPGCTVLAIWDGTGGLRSKYGQMARA